MFTYQDYVDDLLAVADALIDGKSMPDLNRATKCRVVSTLYYALFSELSGSNADAFVGRRLRKAWGEVYRALNHGEARKACRRLKEIQEFPQEIKDFAHTFEQSQDRRRFADYDPSTDFDVVDVQNWCDEIRQVIARFRKVSPEDKCAFAAWVLMHGAGVEAIRKNRNSNTTA